MLVFVAFLRLLISRQAPNQSNKSYYEQFLEFAHGIELLGGVKFFCNESIMILTSRCKISGSKVKLETNADEDVETEDSDLDEISFFTKNNFTVEAEKMKAIIFLLHSDAKRYDNLLKSLEDSDMMGMDNYPQTLASACALLNRETNNITRRSLINSCRKTKNTNDEKHAAPRLNAMFTQWEKCTTTFQFVQNVMKDSD